MGLLTACGGSSTSQPTAPSQTTPPSGASLTVSGTVPGMGAAAPFVATVHQANGTSTDVTGQSVWASSDTSVATVSSTGVVTIVGYGVCQITATYQGMSGSRTIIIGT